MDYPSLKIRGLIKEDYIEKLKEVTEVFSSIRIDMLKDILRLPLYPFIELIFEWVKQREYNIRMETTYRL